MIPMQIIKSENLVNFRKIEKSISPLFQFWSDYKIFKLLEELY